MSLAPPRPRNVILAPIWLLVFSALSVVAFVAALALLYFGLRGELDIGSALAGLLDNIVGLALVMAIASVGLAAGITIFSALRDKRGLRALGLRSAGWRPGLAWFAALLAIHVPLCAMLAASYGPEVVLRNLPYLLAIAPFILVQAGAEEIMFRGWLLPTVAARHGPAVGVTVSTIAFAAAHFSYGGDLIGMAMSIAARAPLGWALAVLALRYNNLGASIGLHTGLNTVLFVFAQITADAEGKSLIEVINEQVTAGSFDTPVETLTFVLSCVQSIVAPVLFVWWFSRKDLPRIFQKPARAEAEGAIEAGPPA